MAKNLAWTWFWPIWPKLWLPNCFLQNLAHQSLDVMVSFHHVQHQKKLSIQSLENLVTDGQTEGQTDGQEWFHTLSDYHWASDKRKNKQLLTFPYIILKKKTMKLDIVISSVTFEQISYLVLIMKLHKINVYHNQSSI